MLARRLRPHLRLPLSASRTPRFWLVLFFAVFLGGLAVGAWLIFAPGAEDRSGAFRAWIAIWTAALTLSGLGLGIRSR